MGNRGPPPTPTKVLKLRGSRRGNMNKNEPEPETGRPKCPSWINTRAKRYWKVLIPMLDQMGVLTKIDGNSLTRYVVMLARWRACIEFLEEHGDTYPTKRAYKGPDGKFREMVTGFANFPQVSESQKLAESLLRLEDRFGLTPSARARLEVPNKPAAGNEGKERFRPPMKFKAG